MAEKRRIAESKNTGVFQDLLRQVKLVYKLMGDKRISFFLKLLPIASIVYLVSPVDLAPGLALPVIGALDDAAVLWLGTTLFLTLCPEEIVQEHKEAMDKVVNATWRDAPAEKKMDIIEVVPMDKPTRKEPGEKN